MAWLIENAYALALDEGNSAGIEMPISMPVAGDDNFLVVGLAVLVGVLILYFVVIRPLMKRKKQSVTSSVAADLSKPAEPVHKPAKTPEMKASGKIFLSYRRNDSADVTGRIYDRLSAKFGEDNIFKDVDSIPLGADFREYIDSMIKESALVLVVIGNDWLGRSGSDAAQKRIDDPRDFVRLEVAVALQRNVNIIPLLVRRAQMPVEEDLPEELKPLAYRNGISIRPDPDFNNDIDRLIYGVQQILSAA